MTRTLDQLPDRRALSQMGRGTHLSRIGHAATESSLGGGSRRVVVPYVLPEQPPVFVLGGTVEAVRRPLEAGAVDDANAIAQRADQPLALELVQGDGDALPAHAHQQRQEFVRYEQFGLATKVPPGTVGDDVSRR